MGRGVRRLSGLDAELLEQLRVAHRQLDHLTNLIEFVVESADVLVGDVRDAFGGGPLAELTCSAGVSEMSMLVESVMTTVPLGDVLAIFSGTDWPELAIGPNESENGTVWPSVTACPESLSRTSGPMSPNTEVLRERDGHRRRRFDVRAFDRHAVVDTDVGFLAQASVDSDDSSSLVLG